ncbi:helical backbone metal receptor [Candidatus Sulfidibacterium hydrothermale]|uniref:ABC transporter substrate-binding protein n=1 Tax=Candidatus Sulfidibacterium hydrothermale TaxID=2875962 RepID=UPI001F0A5C2F|nr:helical backbone metal receptor [Candidatus Sulfidibacterium hydrothermale]UBM62803.1 helical backbone metal receptor [Candidatus Sulfidibacterium hydrothermale]
MVLFFLQNKSLISRKIIYSLRVITMLFTKDNFTEINQIKSIKRVVSLVPSVTETIAFLSGTDILTGVTRFCKYPANIREKAVVVGGTKDFNLDTVIRLKPDLVVGVKEENEKSQIEELAASLPVVLFDIRCVSDAYQMIYRLGELLGKEQKAGKLVHDIQQGFQRINISRPQSGVYLIWKKPWMAAGKETFISDMLARAGFENLVPGRYPVIDESYFLPAPVLLLSSEPFPFREKHRKALLQKYPDKKILLVNGEMFSWYGSHMLQAVDYFRELFV